MGNGEGLALSRDRGGMTAARWKQIETVFEQALDLAMDERGAFLQRACNGDEQLKREVESLLNSHAQAGSFIDDRSQFYPEVDTSVPQLIGHYRIVRELGRGGMGAVYLAERADEYKKQVAIKLIKRGMDTDSVLRHFRNERQILAGFDHPNIARLFDGGTTDDGLPYFVMEYIEGLPIDEYCNKQALSIPDRLKLFREVCAAVSYAHRHLVVHRDIKRSNILVTSDGVPKLLDFGIAKILQGGEGAPTFATMTGQRLMTPEYASPEQVRGEAVTTATDVYSLGVILYELLTGEFPYRFASQTPRDIEHVITATQPEKPSTALAKGENPKSEIRNPKILKGDLDNIVLMALRKESERRYQSVEQFSEDIRRHLEARPVFARKDTAGYRAGKFVRRNKLALAATVLIFLSLFGGIIATRQQKALAERRFNDVRKLAHSVLFDYHDAIKSLPGATKVREQLVKDALSYLDSLAREAHGDPSLQRELAAGYKRVGDVRGGQGNANLGDTAGAADSFSKALRIREALVALQPTDAQARRDLADAHNDLGRCLLYTEPKSSVEHLKKARALFFDLTREHPTSENDLDHLTITSVSLADALTHIGDLGGALEQYRAAASNAEKLVEKKPHDNSFLLSQIIAERALSRALWRQQDEGAEAKTANDKAVRLIQVVIAADPTNTNYQNGLYHLYCDGGQIRAETDPAAALEYFRRAADVVEKLFQADPANLQAELGIADVYMFSAQALSHQGDFDAALSYYSRSADHFEHVFAAAPSNTGAALKAVTGRAGAAAMRARAGGSDVALAECKRLAAHVREIPEDPKNVAFRLFRAEAYEYLGNAYRDIAAASNASATQKSQYIVLARDMFRQSTNIFDDVRSRGGLDASDTKEAKSVAEEMAKCDAALAKP
jgi:eukaryotic-like serine/threonine-protein kinase